MTGVSFVMSYPFSHKTDKHFICDDGDKKKHVDLDQGFENYGDAREGVWKLEWPGQVC